MPDSAAFGRLCVETGGSPLALNAVFQPPSGGCVLKPLKQFLGLSVIVSRLRAAVC